jgi:hypothetical protein
MMHGPAKVKSGKFFWAYTLSLITIPALFEILVTLSCQDVQEPKIRQYIRHLYYVT